MNMPNRHFALGAQVKVKLRDDRVRGVLERSTSCTAATRRSDFPVLIPVG